MIAGLDVVGTVFKFIGDIRRVADCQRKEEKNCQTTRANWKNVLMFEPNWPVRVAPAKVGKVNVQHGLEDLVGGNEA